MGVVPDGVAILVVCASDVVLNIEACVGMVKFTDRACACVLSGGRDEVGTVNIVDVFDDLDTPTEATAVATDTELVVTELSVNNPDGVGKIASSVGSVVGTGEFGEVPSGEGDAVGESEVRKVPSGEGDTVGTSEGGAVRPGEGDAVNTNVGYTVGDAVNTSAAEGASDGRRDGETEGLDEGIHDGGNEKRKREALVDIVVVVVSL